MTQTEGEEPEAVVDISRYCLKVNTLKWTVRTADCTLNIVECALFSDIPFSCFLPGQFETSYLYPYLYFPAIYGKCPLFTYKWCFPVGNIITSQMNSDESINYFPGELHLLHLFCTSWLTLLTNFDNTLAQLGPMGHTLALLWYPSVIAWLSFLHNSDPF